MKWALVAVWLSTGEAYEIDSPLSAADCAREWYKAEKSKEIALTDSIVVLTSDVRLYCSQAR